MVDHFAVWTRKSMIVWGGARGTNNPATRLNTGGRYDPVTDSWQPIASDKVRPGFYPHVVLAGGKMIVWGEGVSQKYAPETDTWTPVTSLDAPDPNHGYYEVTSCAGEMILWSASPSLTVRYDPAADVWRPLSEEGAPDPRYAPNLVCAGHVLVVWSGTYGDDDFDTGGRYDLETDRWAPLSTKDAPVPRSSSLSVWTGHAMIVWGGDMVDDLEGDLSGGRYFLSVTGNEPPVTPADAHERGGR